MEKSFEESFELVEVLSVKVIMELIDGALDRKDENLFNLYTSFLNHKTKMEVL
jgi:hypothetical protein